MLVSGIFNVGLETLGIDRIPPTMSAAYDYLKIVRIDMHSVLDTIVAYDIAKSFFDRWRNSVFAGVHVSDFGMSKALGKFLPCPVRHVVGLADVDAPDTTCRRL